MLKKYFRYIDSNSGRIHFTSFSFFLTCLHVALILFLSDYVTVDEGSRSSLSSEGASPPETVSDGKVSSRAGIGEERKLGQVLPLPRSDHRMPVDGGTPIKAVPRLQRAKGKASQLAQCSRICLPVQETQETRV